MKDWVILSIFGHLIILQIHNHLLKQSNMSLKVSISLEYYQTESSDYCQVHTWIIYYWVKFEFNLLYTFKIHNLFELVESECEEEQDS